MRNDRTYWDFKYLGTAGCTQVLDHDTCSNKHKGGTGESEANCFPRQGTQASETNEIDQSDGNERQ